MRRNLLSARGQRTTTVSTDILHCQEVVTSTPVWASFFAEKESAPVRSLRFAFETDAWLARPRVLPVTAPDPSSKRPLRPA